MDLAKGYRLGDMERGNRILSGIGHGPVAAARDPELSIVTLVPLSHLLGLPVPAIKRTYLFEHGAPLLVDGRRRDADRLTPRDPYAPGSRLTIVGRHQTARPLSSGYQDIVTATYNTRTATVPPPSLGRRQLRRDLTGARRSIRGDRDEICRRRPSAGSAGESHPLVEGGR